MRSFVGSAVPHSTNQPHRNDRSTSGPGSRASNKKSSQKSKGRKKSINLTKPKRKYARQTPINKDFGSAQSSVRSLCSVPIGFFSFSCWWLFDALKTHLIHNKTDPIANSNIGIHVYIFHMTLVILTLGVVVDISPYQ